jgi:catechol 2,3-dioxygenase-like lactoylglutathione lyase family enzyme
LDPAHFIQVGDLPVFSGAGSGELICACGTSTLINGYAARNFLAIRIRCFRCGAITTTPGLPAGEILPPDAVALAPDEVPAVRTNTIPLGAVLADRTEVERDYALTRPRDPPAEPMVLTAATLDAAAEAYDRLTGGRLAEHMAASPPATGSALGEYPLAWSLLRLGGQVGTPGWTWFQHNDDALAAMHVAAMWDCMARWGQHPLLAELVSPLAAPGQFLRTMTRLAAARLLFDAGNRVGFSMPSPQQPDAPLHFSTPDGNALTLALRAPNALQWRERDRRTPQSLRAAVLEALASAQGQVNGRRPGIVVLSASILMPDFDQAIVDAIHAAFRSAGRKHHGVAAVGVVIPKVMPTGQPDQVGFAYAFYPIRNPHFAGENPIRVGTEQDFRAIG